MLRRSQAERAALAGPGPGSERDARASDGARAARKGPRSSGADDARADGAAAPEAHGNGARTPGAVAAHEDDLADTADSGNGTGGSGGDRNGGAESRVGGSEPTSQRKTSSPGNGGAEEQLLLAGHLVDFWTNICVCHSLIVDRSPDGQVNYQVCTAEDTQVLK